jgi:hypothetical protein
MIKAGDLIFTAGPRDYMKGHSEMGHDHELQEVMEMQDKAWQGEAGGQLVRILGGWRPTAGEV